MFIGRFLLPIIWHFFKIHKDRSLLGLFNDIERLKKLFSKHLYIFDHCQKTRYLKCIDGETVNFIVSEIIK